MTGIELRTSPTPEDYERASDIVLRQRLERLHEPLTYLDEVYPERDTESDEQQVARLAQLRADIRGIVETHFSQPPTAEA